MEVVGTKTWPSITTATLTDQVYGLLRDRMLAGKMASGEFVREPEISNALGVSRTPVHEALGRLASEGFLERVAHRGFRVPEESIADLVELYPILAALEVLAGRESFGRLSPEIIEELRAINRAYAEAASRSDFEAGIELNDRFHQVLSQQSQNVHLKTMLDSMRATVRRLETWTFITHPRDWARSIAEHNAILDASERHDFDTALEALKSNRLTTYRRFQREMPETGDGSD